MVENSDTEPEGAPAATPPDESVGIAGAMLAPEEENELGRTLEGDAPAP